MYRLQPSNGLCIDIQRYPFQIQAIRKRYQGLYNLNRWHTRFRWFES